MDTSIFLLIIIFLVALILIAVGVYIIIILREVKANLERIGKILDHFENIADTVDNKIVGPTSSALGIVAAIKEGIEIFKTFKGEHLGHQNKREDYEEAV
jgi:uncharacterized protein YoxC